MTATQSKLKQFRQGDVFIVEIDEIPTSAKKVKSESGRHVLELGTVTGHAHAIAATEGVSMLMDEQKKYLDLSTAANLQHEEHATIEIPPGKYEVRRQCTWSAIDEMSTLVAD